MSVTTRTNLATNPRAASTTGYAAVAGTGGTAALSNLATGGPTVPNVASFNRVTWSVATTAVSGGCSYTVTGLAASTAYAFQVWVRSSKAQTVQLSAAFQTSAPATVNTVTSANVALTANTWTQVTVTGTSGASVVQAVLTVQAVTGGALWAANDTLDMTAVMPETGTAAGTYIDGSFTNANAVVYAWTGTANASTSTATTYVPVLTLTPKTDVPCPRFDVTLTDLPSLDQTASVWRTTTSVRTGVRGARSVTVNASQNWTDYEAPIGQPVQYNVEFTAGIMVGSTATATGTITAPTDAAGKPLWWLQDPLVPGSAVSVAVTRGDKSRPYLTAAAVKNLEYAADISIIPVMGSSTPVGIGGQRMAAGGVSFSMLTNAAQAATDLRNLLQQAAVVLVRTPGNGRDGGLPDASYTAIPKAVERPVTVAFGGTLTQWELAGSVVAAPLANVLVPMWTYGNVAVLWGTYQQAQTAYASKKYLDAQKNPSNA